jgi:hypothetical protein
MGFHSKQSSLSNNYIYAIQHSVIGRVTDPRLRLGVVTTTTTCGIIISGTNAEFYSNAVNHLQLATRSSSRMNISGNPKESENPSG